MKKVTRKVTTIQLPNNCRYSLSVFPSNWEEGGKELLQLQWRINYRFYDDNTGKSKQFKESNINKMQTVKERRHKVQSLLHIIRHALEVGGLNPITKVWANPPKLNTPGQLTRHTPFIEALEHAVSKLKVAPNTMSSEVVPVMSYLRKAIIALKYDQIPIWDVTLKTLYLTCERAAIKRDKTYSGDKFNRCKKWLIQFYKKLLQMEAVQANFPLSLERQKAVPMEPRTPLTIQERRVINDYLTIRSPRFALFLRLFFHSGARLTEMARLKTADIDFKRQVIRYLDLKSNTYNERPMLDNVVEYWQQAIQGAKSGDYVFADELLPAAVPIQAGAIELRWQRMKRAIKADPEQKTKIIGGIYRYKHTHTTEVSKRLGTAAAAELNGESEEMIRKIYDLENTQREQDKLKKVNVEYV